MAPIILFCSRVTALAILLPLSQSLDRTGTTESLAFGLDLHNKKLASTFELQPSST